MSYSWIFSLKKKRYNYFPTPKNSGGKKFVDIRVFCRSSEPNSTWQEWKNGSSDFFKNSPAYIRLICILSFRILSQKFYLSAFYWFSVQFKMRHLTYPRNTLKSAKNRNFLVSLRFLSYIKNTRAFGGNVRLVETVFFEVCVKKSIFVDPRGVPQGIAGQKNRKKHEIYEILF